MAAMHLYHSVGARSLRALWTFKELGMVNVGMIKGAAPPPAEGEVTIFTYYTLWK